MFCINGTRQPSVICPSYLRVTGGMGGGGL